MQQIKGPVHLYAQFSGGTSKGVYSPKRSTFGKYARIGICITIPIYRYLESY